MRLGVCARFEEADVVAAAGADYLESGAVATLIPEQADGAIWESQRQILTALPLPIETLNLFVPGHLRLVGPDGDRAERAAIAAYAGRAIERAEQIGIKVIVFGSGGARRVPDGFDRETAREQIRDFLRVCAAATEGTEVVIAIEPLNWGECNIINSVREAVDDYVTVIDHPGIRVLADTYHMEREDEPLSVITDVAPYLAHVHTADTERLAPGTGSYPHTELFAILDAARYKGRLSIEARISDLAAEAGPSLAYLRSAEAAATKH